MKAILMTKEFWLNSYFSVARFYGGIRIEGHEHMVMPDSGDLLRADFVRYYKKLGRGRLHRLIKDNQLASDKELKQICEKTLEETKTSKNKVFKQEKLFEQ